MKKSDVRDGCDSVVSAAGEQERVDVLFCLVFQLSRDGFGDGLCIGQ